MKKIKFLATALAALAIFSCSKEKIDAQDLTGEKNVIVRVDIAGTTPESRVIEEDQETTAVASTKIYDAALYFLDAAGTNILKGVELTTQQITALTGAGGTKILDVPAAARRLYVVANYKQVFQGGTAKTYKTTYTTLAALKADMVVEIRNQNKRDGAAAISSNFVVMTGESAPGAGGLFTQVGTTNEWTAPAVMVAPIVARIELHNLKLLNSAGTTLQGYKLQGVFVNSTYKKMNLANAKSDPLNLASSDKGKFIENYPDGQNYLCDYVTAGWTAATAAPNYIIPAANSVWGYQIFPTTTTDLVPHVILKFIDVADANAIIPADKIMWVTITGYNVTSFVAGTVYQIKDLIIPLEKATVDPETKNINVTATVTVKTWSVAPLVPNL